MIGLHDQNHSDSVSVGKSARICLLECMTWESIHRFWDCINGGFRMIVRKGLPLRLHVLPLSCSIFLTWLDLIWRDISKGSSLSLPLAQGLQWVQHDSPAALQLSCYAGDNAHCATLKIGTLLEHVVAKSKRWVACRHLHLPWQAAAGECVIARLSQNLASANHSFSLRLG